MAQEGKKSFILNLGKKKKKKMDIKDSKKRKQGDISEGKRRKQQVEKRCVSRPPKRIPVLRRVKAGGGGESKDE